MTKATELWLGRLGGLRVEFLVRGFGMMLCLSALGRLGTKSWAVYLRGEPLSLIVLGICGYLLVLGGARLIVLLATACAGWVFVTEVVGGNLGRGLSMQAAEYPLYPVMPTVCVLIPIMVYLIEGRAQERHEFHRGVDSLIVKSFRWLTLTTLFWVAFHKLNWDFLSFSGSCDTVLQGELPKNWRGGFLPWVASFSSPWLVLAVEGPIAIGLLIFARRLGIIAVCLLLTMVSLINAIVVTLAVMIPAMAFLPASDVPVIRRHWKRFGLVWMGLAAVTLTISYAHYQGRRPWYEFGLHQAIVLAILVLTGGCQLVAWFGTQSAGLCARDRLLRGLGARPKLLGEWRPGKVLLGLFALALFVNGLCPYLGIKFEYSFAMLSNLRVDDARWNHLLMPRWIRLTPHDHFVHLTRFESLVPPDAKVPRPPMELLHPALYTPWVVSDRLERLIQTSPRALVHVELKYKGTQFEFTGRAGDEALRRFLNELPAKSRWFQNELTLSGQQPCAH